MSELKIEFKAATVGYYSDEPVLYDLNFAVHTGEVVYLTGKTASGKSTLLKTMYAEIEPLAGTVRIADYDMNHIKQSQIPYLRRKVALVFQDFQLLSDRSVYENLLFVLKATGWAKLPEINERINTVLTQVGMFDKQSKMPHQLSGGEQQRVVIARALLNSPEVMLADEPTGNLDPETSDEIFSLLHCIAAQGCAVFFVTHNHQLLKKYPARTLQCIDNTIREILEEERVIDFDTFLEE
ncbi:MAG: ATP-binding cassette domain-containing protein [Bacteroidales bacterium]|jgi:cell division transport system ATP-binding protein|nr:ATP-binding cassette domain-containing protein [Bacteroidales bacterium]